MTTRDASRGASLVWLGMLGAFLILLPFVFGSVGFNIGANWTYVLVLLGATIIIGMLAAVSFAHHFIVGLIFTLIAVGCFGFAVLKFLPAAIG